VGGGGVGGGGGGGGGWGGGGRVRPRLTLEAAHRANKGSRDGKQDLWPLLGGQGMRGRRRQKVEPEKKRRPASDLDQRLLEEEDEGRGTSRLQSEKAQLKRQISCAKGRQRVW